jgi:hypothetical protein
MTEVDGDDDEGEFDTLPNDDEDAVGREPRTAESSSHPTNAAAGIQKKPVGPLKLRSSMPKWLKTNFYGKFLITVTVLLGFQLDFRGVAPSNHRCQRLRTTADRDVTISRCMMTSELHTIQRIICIDVSTNSYICTGFNKPNHQNTKIMTDLSNQCIP